MRATTQICAALIGLAAAAGGSHAGEIPDLAGYRKLELDPYPVTRSERPLEIILGLGEAHASLEEGIDTAIAISRAGDKIIADLELRGYEDDSVHGENFRAVLEQRGELWVLAAVGRQSICARGPQAGQATDQLCP